MSMRKAAWCQPLQEISVPLGALMVGALRIGHRWLLPALLISLAPGVEEVQGRGSSMLPDDGGTL